MSDTGFVIESEVLEALKADTEVWENFLQKINLSLWLPLKYSVLLIVLSILITIAGGLLPAKKAAKKDPVIALRTDL